ncbi:MAG: hypothetical protein STHCBS139747_007912, partial [Sporothrix thermara]
MATALAVPPSKQINKTANPTDWQLTTDANCTCYLTNGSTPSYYSHHKFFDFRRLGRYAGTPPIIQSVSENAIAPPTSEFFASDAWSSMWQAQTWNNSEVIQINDSVVSGSDATVLMLNTHNNIYIDADTKDNTSTAETYMVLRTARAGAFQSAAEIDSVSAGFHYMSIRMYARTVGAPGAVTALFTYRPPANDSQTIQEADLEICTGDPENRIQLTNQPSHNTDGELLPQATHNATMPVNKAWSKWATYRMDWTPGATTWYVDGVLVATIKSQVPRDPSYVILNSWSNGGSWSGVMADGKAAELQVQWIEMVFNNTDAKYKPPLGACSN